MPSKPKKDASESSTPTELWVFVLVDSPQWRAWKRLEAPGGKRWAFRYRDPAGRGIGCDVPSEWPPGYTPSVADLAWRPSPRADGRPMPAERREYLLPKPGQHIGRFEKYEPGANARRILELTPITEFERNFHDAMMPVLNPCKAGPYFCSPRLRKYLDEMSQELGSPPIRNGGKHA